METKRPLILICNDDGYTTPGIKTLTRLARQLGDVVVSAPQDHQSGKSSAITVDYPLRANLVTDEPGFKEYAVTGTPSDCCKLAYDVLLDGRRPDLMLSGINHGYNAAMTIINSGTLGATFESLMHGVPSVAFSLGDHRPTADFSHCEKWITMIIERVLEHGLPEGVCLNVNFPPGCEPKGLKVTRAASGHWDHEFETFVDPWHRTGHWMAGEFVNHEPEDDTTDYYWLDRGWVSVNPCHIDFNAYKAMPAIENMLKQPK